MKELLFSNWEGIWHTGICAVLAYFTLLLFIRISGKRTIAKLTAFDFIVTVTLGSTLSSMILAKVTLTEGAIALAVIIALQYLLAWSAKKSKTFEKALNHSPTLIFYRGAFLEEGMEKEMITEEEVYAEIRKYRLLDVEDVEAVIIEINGEVTVVKKSPGTNHSSLKGVKIPVS